ncbi:MAG TPA: glycosyltransferase family A protein [Stellaceae bacterium]|nr:glycosyltransferase family A protein [Stellaceae bacterium]
MTESPLVTVVMPCFNAARTVRDAMAAARAQSYRPIEIIAVDDGSTDDTLALLRQAAGSDLQVIACAQNGGVAAARNRAIAAARGEFLAFLDADDTWAPDKLSRQMAIVAADARMVLIGCRAEVHYVDGTRAIVNRQRMPPQGAAAWLSMLHHSYLVPSMVIARTATARTIGGFDESLRSAEEDQDFFIRMALQGEVGFVDACLTAMHEQPASLSSRNRNREYETVLPMIERHCRLLGERLTPGQRRTILGARLTAIGRGVYPTLPRQGLALLAHAIAKGDAPLANLYYLLTASPWGRRLKARLRHSAGAETLART